MRHASAHAISPGLIRRNGGTVLLLALVIMSGVVISSVGLSSLILSSLQQSRIIDSASIAYYAAETGAEEVLFKMRRDPAIVPATQTVASPQALTNNATWTRTVTDREKVIYVGTVPRDSFTEIALYDPDAPTTAQNLELAEVTWTDACAGCSVLLGTLVGWTSGGPIVWDPNAATQRIPWDADGAEFSLDGNKLYRLRLSAKNAALENVQVKAYAGGLLADMPGRVKIDSQGTFAGVRQRLTVTLPRQPPLSGIFDFVVFSECSLVKSGVVSCP